MYRPNSRLMCCFSNQNRHRDRSRYRLFAVDVCTPDKVYLGMAKSLDMLGLQRAIASDLELDIAYMEFTDSKGGCGARGYEKSSRNSCEIL